MAKKVLKTLIYVVYFSFLAGVGILLGCYIHGARTNQGTLMSGVAFVRELPYGEQTVGRIETAVFSRAEQQHLEDFQEKHKGQIQIDPEVLKQQEKLFQKQTGKL